MEKISQLEERLIEYEEMLTELQELTATLLTCVVDMQNEIDTLEDK